MEVYVVSINGEIGAEVNRSMVGASKASGVAYRTLVRSFLKMGIYSKGGVVVKRCKVIGMKGRGSKGFGKVDW